MSQASKKASETRKGDSRPNRNKSERGNTRVPIGQARDKLTVQNGDLNRHYRWVEDREEGNRVAMFERAGYRMETTDSGLVIGQRKMSDTGGEGSNIRLYAGRDEEGKASYYYLMSISREWYEEDQAAKQSGIDELERNMKETPDGVDYIKKASVDDDTKGHIF